MQAMTTAAETAAAVATKTELASPVAARTVLVTGGSRGIGAAAARCCAELGFDVVVNYTRDAGAAQAVVDRVVALGRRAIALQADVSVDAAQREGAIGPLHGLVNNAGVVDRAARVEQIDIERLQRMFAINVFGSFLCAREAVKRLSTRHGGPGGAIVNLSSAAARLGGPGQYVDYAAAKGAIDTFTIGLAREVATEGIRVNAVRPGIIETDIHASGGQPDRAQQLAPQVPMQRAGSADEVGRAIAWLLSDAASYTTGSLLDVTGGR
jgi:NAD(P)-dependent dehydrogenase (short-subunit alcohol dehydrogenase family)